MKKAIAHAVENQAKPVKAGARGAVHHAKVVAAKPASSKAARQAAFKQEVAILHLSPVAAVDRARLIPAVDVKAFRIICMPG
jgi:RNase P/RNase MRP subunit p30